ncbi:unnamed protein product [Ilex paraguariensis]|uniref:Uncharacterized protein n=1 Tax=Ilex paraguariensis TaxID=185542 RepID=A0ABC8U0X2_9AQUA
MASVLQSPWLCPHKPIKPFVSSAKPNFINPTFNPLKVSSSLAPSNAESSSDSDSPGKSAEAELGKTDPVKLAFEKAKAYKKSVPTNPTPKVVQDPVQQFAETGDKNGGLVSEVSKAENKEVPIAFKLAMERANEYKDKGIMDSSKSVERNETTSEGNAGNFGKGFVERRVDKKKEPQVSSIDFMGLNFADKKDSRGLPAGLVPPTDPFPEGNIPEVEIIVGDASNFGDAAATKAKPIQKDNSDLYKPRVSTWGVFPRPGNISKTYGGGRNIRPGEVLETVEDRVAKEAHTKQLLAAYKSQIGLNIDPRLKSECEKVLKDGDSLMDLGKLKEALPFYEKVMDKLPYKSELHGIAALQWSICQDSLSRCRKHGCEPIVLLFSEMTLMNEKKNCFLGI